MSATTEIVLTASLTVIGGVVVFSLTTILEKLFISPVLAVRKYLGDVSFALQVHGWAIMGDRKIVGADRVDQAAEEMRSMTARLRAEANGVPCYRFFARVGVLPPYRDLVEGAGCVVRVSILAGRSAYLEVMEDYQRIERLLRVDVGHQWFRKEEKG